MDFFDTFGLAMASFIWFTPMSLLFSVVGFCVQLCVIASLGAIIINSVCPPSADSVFISEDHPSGAELSVMADDLLQSMIDILSDDADATLPITSSYCAKSMVSASYTTTIDELLSTGDDYSALTIRELKALCRERGVKRYSNLRKHELVELLSAL